MRLISITELTPQLISVLLTVWEDSVRATHHFLTDTDVLKIRGYVPDALLGVPHLIAAVSDDGRPLGFMGVSGSRLEMLFVKNAERGKGIGKTLLAYGMDRLGVNELTVNEQNPDAMGFYRHFGFRTYRRTDCDEQGAPFPLSCMRLG